jgi:hypothetical protein
VEDVARASYPAATRCPLSTPFRTSHGARAYLHIMTMQPSKRPGPRRPESSPDRGRLGLWPIRTALGISFLAAALGLTGLALLALFLLPGTASVHDEIGALQLVFAFVAGAGALVALVVAYRRQKVAEADSAHDRTRVFNERFTTIAGQFDDAQPAVRLAGVHAMAGWLTTGKKTGKPASMSYAPTCGCRIKQTRETRPMSKTSSPTGLSAKFATPSSESLPRT